MSLGNDPAELTRRTEPEMCDCWVCGEDHPKSEMDTIDVSGEEQYYPEIRYLCLLSSTASERKEDENV